jgi:hypothetical protein
MFDQLTVRTALEVIAVGILFCLGWSAWAAVWGWITAGGQPPMPAILGLIIVVVVFVLLAVL